MLPAIRIVRGDIGTALTWTLPWGAAGIALRLLLPSESGLFPSMSMLLSFGLDFSLFGAVKGTGYALGVVAMGAKRLDRINYRSMAAVGGAITLAICGAELAAGRFRIPAGVLGFVLSRTLTMVTLSASCAVATLWAYRRSLKPRNPLHFPSSAPRHSWTAQAAKESVVR